MRTFRFEGQEQTVQEWAAKLGLSRAAFAMRLSRFERGEITDAQLMRRAQAPKTRPLPPPSRFSEADVRAALEQSAGSIAGASGSLGLSRQWTDTLVERYGLRGLVNKLRARQA